MESRAKKIIRGVFLTLLQTAIVAGLVLGIRILWMDGMILTGIPSADEVAKVTVSYLDQVQELTDPDEIARAVQLAGFLKYDLLAEAGESGTPLVTLCYIRADGRQVSAAADLETVWWKGQARRLKEPEIFVSLTEGLFFSAGD